VSPSWAWVWFCCGARGLAPSRSTFSGLVGIAEWEPEPKEVPLLLRCSNIALSARILGVMLRILFPESLPPPPQPDDPLPPVGDVLGDVSETLAGTPAPASSGLLSSLTSSGMAARLEVDSIARDEPEPGIHEDREEESKTDTIRLVAVAKADAEWWCFEALAWVTVLAVEARLGAGLEPRKALASDATMFCIQLHCLREREEVT
jgi:hypothetical protein